MTPKAAQLNAILVRLAEGEQLTLQFKSSQEREAFRVALYKCKRDLDDSLMLLDDGYQGKKLRFYVDAINTTVALSFYSEEESSKPYEFEIIEN